MANYESTGNEWFLLFKVLYALCSTSSHKTNPWFENGSPQQEQDAKQSIQNPIQVQNKKLQPNKQPEATS